jgi:hypothetical protein
MNTIIFLALVYAYMLGRRRVVGHKSSMNVACLCLSHLKNRLASLSISTDTGSIPGGFKTSGYIYV